MKILQSELLRYLGYKSGQELNDRTLGLIEDAKKLCLEAIQPRHVVRLFDYDGTRLSNGYRPGGEDIKRHLKGSKKVYLFSATIGDGIERKEAELFARSSALALIFDSCASCAIESYCDDVCNELARQSDLPLTPRFSCGYGDYPLTDQLQICTALDTVRRIGVYTDSRGLLVPRKSVTALIGVGGNAKTYSCKSKCEECGNLRCAFRKTDKD